MKKLISFFEIPCIDFRRAITFYETIFDTKLDVFECDSEKMAFFSDDTAKNCGAISWAENFKPSGAGVLVSLCCENMNKTLDLIIRNGGKIQIPKTAIECEDRGYFSVFIDSEGNRLGLWSAK